MHKIPKVIGFKNHTTLWVSVADPEGLAPGEVKSGIGDAVKSSTGAPRGSIVACEARQCWSLSLSLS